MRRSGLFPLSPPGRPQVLESLLADTLYRTPPMQRKPLLRHRGELVWPFPPPAAGRRRFSTRDLWRQGDPGVSGPTAPRSVPSPPPRPTGEQKGHKQGTSVPRSSTYAAGPGLSRPLGQGVTGKSPENPHRSWWSTPPPGNIFPHMLPQCRPPRLLGPAGSTACPFCPPRESPAWREGGHSLTEPRPGKLFGGKTGGTLKSLAEEVWDSLCDERSG